MVLFVLFVLSRELARRRLALKIKGQDSLFRIVYKSLLYKRGEEGKMNVFEVKSLHGERGNAFERGRPGIDRARRYSIRPFFSSLLVPPMMGRVRGEEGDVDKGRERGGVSRCTGAREDDAI